jgi:hypothetical protein
MLSTLRQRSPYRRAVKTRIFSPLQTLQTLPNSQLFIVALWEDFHKRSNWIHIGSEQAGPRVAAIVSVIETCRRLNIPVRDYLCSTLPGLADFPINRISELTPASWLTRN